MSFCRWSLHQVYHILQLRNQTNRCVHTFIEKRERHKVWKQRKKNNFTKTGKTKPLLHLPTCARVEKHRLSFENIFCCRNVPNNCCIASGCGFKKYKMKDIYFHTWLFHSTLLQNTVWSLIHSDENCRQKKKNEAELFIYRGINTAVPWFLMQWKWNLKFSPELCINNSLNVGKREPRFQSVKLWYNTFWPRPGFSFKTILFSLEIFSMNESTLTSVSYIYLPTGLSCRQLPVCW